MRSRVVAASLASVWLAAPRLAAAEPRKLLVMQSEGRADVASLAKIDAAIIKLARTIEPQASAGELNFSDAATAVGCKPDTASCRDEVLGMLAVDEIVITSVSPKPGGLEVSVRRVTKGGVTRDATMFVAAGAPLDRLDGIAPLFSDEPSGRPAPAAPPVPAVRAAPPVPAVRAAPTAPTGPAGGATKAPGSASLSTAPTRPEPELIPAPTAARPESPTTPAPSPNNQVAVQPSDRPERSSQSLELAGMGGGAGMVVLGAFLWGAARGVQSDIDGAPTRTRDDLAKLRDLESKGDAYADLGNLFVVGGLVLGGISTYFYIRDHRSTSSAATLARLTPSLLPHGAGVMLTIGGTP